MPKTKKHYSDVFYLKVTPLMVKAVKEAAARDRTSVSAWIRLAIREKLEREN